MSMCEMCQQNLAQYCCLKPECVKITGNTMYCYQCHWQQHRNHTPYCLEQVYQIARTNCKRQIENIQLIIQKNSREQHQLLDFLESQKVIYLQWHDSQKKSINGSIENENQKLSIKIKELQSVQSLQNLDLILNNCINEVEQYELQYQKESQQQEIERQLQIQDIQSRINFIKDLKFSIPDLSNIFINLQQTSIPKADEKASITYKQCVAHSKPQKYLCTHKDCIGQNSAYPFYCETCLIDVHKQHDSKTFAKKYKAIKQEQDEKTLLIIQEQEKFKQFMQQELNKNYELIQQQLKEKMNKYEKIKDNMSKIKEQSINYLNKLIKFIFIENNINASLLSKSIEGIKQEYQFQYKSFSQKMSIDLQMESREILTFSAQIDQKIEKEQNDLNLLNQELKSKNEQINKLKSQLNGNSEFLSRYSNFHNQLYLLKDNQESIKQLINELTRNIKEKLNSQYCMGVKREFFKSFDNDFKLIQGQISKIDLIIQNIILDSQYVFNNQGIQPKNYIQVNQFRAGQVNQQFQVNNPNIGDCRIRGQSIIKIQEVPRVDPKQPQQAVIPQNQQVYNNQLEQSIFRKKQIQITSICDLNKQGQV